MRAPLACLLVLVLAARALAGGGPAETVVLVNARSEDSRRVAAHYVAARSVPARNVCEVRCDTALDVPVDAFVRDVVDPLRAFLADRGLEERCRYVVLTQGMPIRARTPGGHVSTAALLAVLDTPLCGAPQTRLPAVPNPYTEGCAPRDPIAAGGRFLLVTALLSTTADEAVALIDRSVASDGTAPADALWIYQDANGAAGVRNAHYDAARARLEPLGQRTEHLPAGGDRATGRRRVMGYMSGGSYSGLTVEGVGTNEYLPGALCDMLQSFGAVPQNFTDGKPSQFPVTHMVRAGVTGVHGAVAEPYNVSFPDADLFLPYLRGHTLAETYHQRMPQAYWMNLVLGDPLCAPYAVRPAPRIEGPAGPWSGTVTVEVAAPGAVRLELYVDGEPAGVRDGERAAFPVDTLRLPDGDVEVLVQAIGPGEAEPCGYVSERRAVRNTTLRVLELPRAAAAGQPIRIALSRPPRATERPRVEVDTGGAAVRGASAVEGAELVFAPEGDWPRARRLAVRVLGVEGEPGCEVPGPPASLGVEAPARVVAGQTFEVRVTARDADGLAWQDWAGRVELRTEDPPVRWAAEDAVAGTVVLPLRLLRAGEQRYRTVALGDDLAAEFTVRVDPAPPHHATTPLSAVPLGQAVDLPVRVEDEFGNLADWEGELALAAPRDRFADPGGRARVAGGRGVFRDVVLATEGAQPLVFTDLAGKTWSQPGEGVRVAPAAVRRWLVAEPAPAREAAGLWGADPDPRQDGGLGAGRVFRRRVESDDEVELGRGGGSDGDAAAAVAHLRVVGETAVRLLGAAPGRLRVLVDGAVVFDGVPGETDPRGKRALLGEATLADGVHRIAVVAERRGRFGFSLAVEDARGGHPSGARVLPGGGPPEAPVVSGRVRLGERGLSGVRVTALGADGARRTAVTGADGSYHFEGLPEGRAEFAVEADSAPSRAPVRAVVLGSGHLVDVDLVVEDRDPPSVESGLVRGRRFGRTLVVVPEVADDDTVRSVRLLLGGREIARDEAAPWELRADVGGIERGRHAVAVEAVDASGNAARSAPVEIELVEDREGPTVRLRGLAPNALLRRRTEVVASVADPIGLAEVRFELDGARLGPDPAAEPYRAALDPAGLAEGPHALVCIARDLDGNETRETLRFRVK